VTFLRLSEVGKSFGARPAVSQLCFELALGEIVGLVGPNGSGKSTVLSMVCGLLEPDAGRVELGDPPGARRVASELGAAFQQVALYEALTCEENLSFFGSLYGLRGPRLRGRVAACLHDVQLEARRGSLARELSGGMQRRLHLAAALLHEPRLIVLDEPTAGLDIEARTGVWALCRKLRLERRAVLLTTHLLDEAEALCDRVGVLQQGRLVALGTPEQLRAMLPAKEIVQVVGPDLKAIRAAAERHELTTRTQEQAIDVWLPRHFELRELVELFDGLGVTTLAQRPVTLQDAYLEILLATNAQGVQPARSAARH
jgi:ABC-2 type transport system ATP-binding protein